MKYFTIAWPDDNDNDRWETLSEQDILNQYWDYWYGKMCDKFGKEYVDMKYTKQDCIDDWCVIHWAEENGWVRMKNEVE